ncbi:MAG: hypothetical protein KatS3mg065_0435 [Chloroflexota bacterium]|nr:MAG: hypothetical protein KatS3mg065_0435 [Chloroflexota bacterium]
MIVEPPRSRPAEGVEGGRDEAEGVEADVLPEGLVLDGRRGVDELRRELVEGDELAPGRPEASQLDRPGPVVDDRLLVEGEVLEDRPRVRKALGVLVVGENDAGEPDETDDEEGAEEEEGEGDGDGDGRSPTSRWAATVAEPTLALPPREAGVHAGGDDSIGTAMTLLVSFRRFDRAPRGTIPLGTGTSRSALL